MVYDGLLWHCHVMDGTFVMDGIQIHSPTLLLLLSFNIRRLGHKIQGVLCDGNTKEVVASTVVNCLRINEGKTCYIPTTFCILCIETDTFLLTLTCHYFPRDHHYFEGRMRPSSTCATDL